MKQKLSLLILLFLSLGVIAAEKQFKLHSPDRKITVEILIGNTIKYAVSHENDRLLDFSEISMVLDNGTGWGINPRLIKSSKQQVKETIDARTYKKAKVDNHYNALTLFFKSEYQLVFRAYNDGIAYRFISTCKKPFKVKSEQATFNFPQDQMAYISYVRKNNPRSFDAQFLNSFENLYVHSKLSEWDQKRYAFLPILIEYDHGKRVGITEADLMDYPGMFLYNGDASNSLKGVFAPFPKEVRQGGHNQLQALVKSRENYIASYQGSTKFPWRTLIIAEHDYELTDNDMVYRLASPTVNMDFSWVKPGKVAWEWWNHWNLYGVDFKTGINNQTYKYYIDFASKYNIEYVILDEGWAVKRQADLFQVVPEIDLPELVSYANKKGVGLILWAGYYAFDRDMERVCKHYSEMGIKGFKVDFMDRDDQVMVAFHKRAAETAAKYNLLINFHGTYKPTGLQRTYPNVLNFEGVYGLEQMKWAENVDMVRNDVIIPFVRQLAGPMDYTQGAMRNATKKHYRAVYGEAMSQGTRCRQLAEYIIFESPLNMLCDNPVNYEREAECTRFISEIPTVWDETKALNGKIAEYITIARRSGKEWYVGSLTNWDTRDLEVDLSFLGEGDFIAEIFKDGINADKIARDYKQEIIPIPEDKQLKIHMASGGGWTARIKLKTD